MVAISARSRSPIKVLLSIESSSLRASSADSTGVLPRFTTYFGPRTEAAGLTSRIPPVVRESNSCLIAARCCLTVGFEAWSPSCSMYAATVTASISQRLEATEQGRALSVGSCALVLKNFLASDFLQGRELQGGVLVLGRDAGIAVFHASNLKLQTRNIQALYL